MKTPKEKILDAIAPKVEELLKTVQEYESDTFSATGSELTEEEAIIITVALIEHATQQLIDTDTLDGVRLAEELENIRECIACREDKMKSPEVRNALSRYCPKYICSDCGTREAMEGDFWHGEAQYGTPRAGAN